jgi:hypothetical protein
MSIGAYILAQVGDPKSNTFRGLPSDLECAVTEIRIEQHLDRRATFAIRFQEDFEDGESKAITADDLRGAKGMAILVDGGPGQPDKNAPAVAPSGPGELICLFRGQVENSESDVSVGGSGSWYEVRGQDVRTLAARGDGGESHGKVSKIAQELASDFTSGTFTPDDDDIATFELGYPYRWTGTKLEALEELSALCDCPVRLIYNLEKSVIAVNRLGQENFDITVDVHFEPSPSRGEDLPPGAPIDLGLIGGKTTYLRIMGSEGACENVINFALQSYNEAISSVSSSVVSRTSGGVAEVEGQKATQAAMTPDAQDVKKAGAKDNRSARINYCGNDDLGAAAARAAANEASWYVKANALTTVHLLGKVVQPHDVVEVIGGGCGLNGMFQVEKVVHVINAAAHWMHIDLRGNSLSIKDEKEGII